MQQTPPHFPEGERAVLAGCLLDASVVDDVCETLAVSDFYHEAHRWIFRAMGALNARGCSVDWVTMTRELKRLGRFEDIGGAAFLAELSDASPSAANWRHYAEKVKDCSVLRRTIASAHEVITACYSPDADPKTVSDLFWNRANLGLATTESDDLIPEDTVIQDYIRALEDGTGRPFCTGLAKWDELLGGLYPGQFIVIGGRPSMGKSSLLISMFKHLLGTTDFGLALFSLEMTQAQIAARRLADACQIPIHTIRSKKLGEREWAAVIDKSADFYESKLFISDRTGITCSQIEQKILKAERTYGLKFGVVGVDFMQIMGSDTKERDEVKRLDSIAYGLQALAKRLNCCVIALSQLSNLIEQRPAFTVDKQGEIRHGRRPTLADIRGSGMIVAAARLVIGVYRASAYEDEMLSSMDKTKYQGTAEAIVRKNNDGPCGSIPLSWHAETATFGDRPQLASTTILSHM